MRVKKEPVGFLIKELREKAGLSQRKLGKLTGLDRGYISQLETGKTVSITIRIAERFAKGLGITTGTLVDYITIEDEDIRSFMANELPALDDEAKSWLRHTISVIRERAREKYKAGEG